METGTDDAVVMTETPPVRQKLASIMAFLLSIAPLIIRHLFPVAVTWLELFIFVIAVYQLDIVGMLFGDESSTAISKKKKRAINLATSIACACMLVGMDTFLSALLDVLEGLVQNITDTAAYLQEPATVMTLLGAVVGLGIVTTGILVIWFSATKQLQVFSREEQQVLGTTIGGFAMWAVFLGMGGETLISYFLILVNGYHMIRNLRNVHGIKDLVRRIKQASEAKNKIEDSFWANWVNFHKTPHTRFFGTVVTTTALIVGVNFRFVELDPFHVLFMAIAVLPFIIAVLGLRHAWTSNARVAASLVPYIAMIVLSLAVPTAMPVTRLVAGLLPDLFLLNLAFITMFLGIVMISGTSAMAKTVCKTTGDAASVASIMILSTFMLVFLIAIVLYITLAFNLIYFPLYYDARVLVPVTLVVLGIASLMVLHAIRKQFYYKNLILVSTHHDDQLNREPVPKGGTARRAREIARRKRLSLTRGTSVAIVVMIAALLAAEVPLSWVATTRAPVPVSSEVTFDTGSYYYVNLVVDSPLNISITGGTDTVACYVFDLDENRYVQGLVAGNGSTATGVFEPGSTRRVSLRFFIIEDHDDSGDGTVLFSIQATPAFRLTGVFFIAAGMLIVYAFIARDLVAGKVRGKRSQESG